MARHNIYINESQFSRICSLMNENSGNWFVDTNKVLLIKKYLDSHFKQGKMRSMGDNGYFKNTPIVCEIDPKTKEELRNMTASQLFEMLQDRFQGIYGDKNKRDSFIKKVMIDWYNGKIDRNGIISTNKY